MPYNLETREKILADLATVISEKLSLKQAKLAIAFANQYFSNVALEDLNARSITNLYEILISQWDLIYQRAPGEVKINIYLASACTVIEVVIDDMPFLVDSLRMEILRQEFAIHFMIHMGGINFRRNAEHQIIEVLPLDASPTEDKPEAPIHIEIDRQADPKVVENLRENLLRVLGDVQVAVEDWPKMRECLQTALAELERNAPPLDLADVEESKDFLRWLDNDHFTYLGCRDYEVVGEGENRALRIVRDSGLGVLRAEEKSKAVRPFASMPAAARELALAPRVLVISKTNTKATVHRSVYTDYIGIKRFNKAGELTGEHRFIGLFTSTAYHSHPKDIPLLRRKVAIVMQDSKLPPKGHAGKALLDILAALPRDDLFQATTDELTQLTLGILYIQERHQIRLFIRQDTYRRFVSCLVYVPRERFNTDLRIAMQDALVTAFKGSETTFSIYYSESLLARVHFLIRIDPKVELVIDTQELEMKLIEIARSWQDELRENLIEYYGEEKGTELANKYGKAFPAGYRDDFTPNMALYDIEHIERLSASHDLEMNLSRSLTAPPGSLSFKLFHPLDPVVLSDALPMLENMGLRVLDEHPYKIEFKDGSCVWIHEFSMNFPQGQMLEIEEVKDIFQEAFTHIWCGNAENDGFNRLVLSAQLTWREAALLRAYTKYLRQTGFTFSQAYVEAALAKNAAIAKKLTELFILFFDPENQMIATSAIPEKEQQLQDALEAVVNLDEDRILRRLLEVIRATLRTNYFQLTEDKQIKPWLSFKLNPARISDLPLPRPMYEVFVYSPRVEAVHLRAAKVARGGIRWSDRREDFRTEVLGLMKAQQVKNALIVPAGAKGGFVVKCLPEEGSRETIMAEVIACYQTFMRGLLDLTDNFQEGRIIPPLDTVRYDEDDPYLVVAADKGTASFSDLANAISAEYNFWLGDAFASGGSAGYDHKKMAITARGAWESVKRHFSFLGCDPQTEDFTVVGIGDMSGDVFGNGMLQSHHIKLVAAFNHAHIFLDPNPDAAASYAERQRLFNLPRSTWEDYNPSLISLGGGVFKRSAKVIPLSPEVQQLLNLTQDVIDPEGLIRVLLTARVDLLWNGGIGTYVKSIQERHSDVGDRSNDALRVNGNQLQCKVVGEGGNLGFTQLGRVEYAFKGGLIYTDFIDNSGGVDCSDHEVNCKILLHEVMTTGEMTLEQRNQLLTEMTTEIASLVLQDNYAQTRAISLACTRAFNEIELHRRYIGELERANKLDRALEFLPDDKTLLERKAIGKGLCSPELAILFAYTKMLIKAELLKTDILEDTYLAQAIELGFPHPLRERFSEQMGRHGLRREIVATQLTNMMVNEMGITFIHRIREEMHASLCDIVRAFMVARTVFNLSDLINLAENLSISVPPQLRYDMMWQASRMVRRGTRWFLCHSKHLKDIAETIKRFSSDVAKLAVQLPQFLIGNEHDRWEGMVADLKAATVPENIAIQLANIRRQYALLDIIEASTENNIDIERLARVYFMLGEQMGFSWMREQITQQAVETQWDILARAAMRDDLDVEQRNLSIAVLRDSDAIDVTVQLEKWLMQQKVLMTRWQQLLSELRSAADIKPMMLSVAVHELGGLVRSACSSVKRKTGKRQGTLI